MKKIAITDHVFPSVELQRAVIEEAGIGLQEIQPACKSEDDVIQRCGGFDALLVQWAPITRKVLEALPKVQCVVRYGIGVDNIDLQAAKDLGRMVANVPTFCLEEVSNHALAMILSLGRRIPQGHHRIVRGEWGVTPLLPIPSFEDSILGLVGFGAIARRVCDKAKVFGFRVIASDPFVDASVFEGHGAQRVDFDSLISSVDIVSLHCPLLASTKHLIRRETLDKMKPRSIVVNTSRGPLIKEDELIGALVNGKLSGAGLDVFEVEPLPATSPLRTLSNVILTSHAASVSERARKRLQISAAEGARDFLLGKKPAGALF